MSDDIDFLEDLHEEVVYLLYQVHRRRESSLAEALEAEGLPLTTWRMLLALERMQPCTMNNLARYTTVERSALTRNLDQMVKQGLVVRSTPPQDRRQVLVTLTDAGMRKFLKGREIVMRWNRKALERMAPVRLDALRDGLKGVLRSILSDEELADEIIAFNNRSPTKAD